CLPVDLGIPNFSVINFFWLRRACSQSAQSVDTAFFSSAQTNENLSISRRARRSLRFKKAWFDSADTRGRDNPQRRRSFIPHSESRTPHWPERLRKTRGKCLRRSIPAGKALTSVGERLSKNPRNLFKMLTKSKMLTQISLRQRQSGQPVGEPFSMN